MDNQEYSGTNEYYLHENAPQNQIVRRTHDNIWLPAIFMVALFFFVGLGIWNLANYRSANDPMQNGTEFGIGGAPGEMVSPLPSATSTPTPIPEEDDVNGPLSTTGATGPEGTLDNTSQNMP